MATSGPKAPLTAYNTALVLLPPREFAHRVAPFRAVHDKAGTRWPAHITTIFPFVEETNLPETVDMLREVVRDIVPFTLKIDAVNKFSMRDYDTVHLTVGRPQAQVDVQHLWKSISAALGYKGRPFVPHVTLGQASNRSNPEALQFLNAKAQDILASVKDLEWIVGSIVVLKKDEKDGGIMKLYDEIFLQGHTESAYQPTPLLPTMVYAPDRGWRRDDLRPSPLPEFPSNLTVSSYNILHDPAFPIIERIGSLVKETVQTASDILCLQEVSDESLALLLSSPLLFSLYPYSSRDPVVVQENERNILILSRLPFKTAVVDTGTKHKPACFAIIDFEGGRQVVVAAIHLTAGRAVAPLEQKTRELSNVVKELTEKFPTSDWIIAGDLNWPNEISSTPVDRFFEDVGEASMQPTYDPTRNRLAALTARESKTGQRYDRIFLKRGTTWKPKGLELFGVNDEPASDHWGIKATFRRSLISSTEGPANAEVEDIPSTQCPTASISLADIHTSFEKEAWLPSPEQEDSMRRALVLLRTVICAPVGERQSNVILKLEPVGSYALGVHTRDSDIDCLTVGNISPQTFWKLARFRVRASSSQGENGIKLRRFVKDAIVQMMELEAYGVKIDLQYCAASNLVESWDELPSLPADSPLFSLPLSSLVTLNAFRDVLTLQRILPSLAAFQTAHRALKLYLTRRGLSGARFGYLGGFHLTLLLAQVALTLPRTAQASHLIESFLKTYAKWNWEKDIVYPIPSRKQDIASPHAYKRVLHKEPMVVLSIERPLSNLMHNASRNSVVALSRVFRQAYQRLENGDGWLRVCAIDQDPLEDFVNNYKAFIKLDASYWGGDCMKGRAFIGWLESRFVSFMVQLHLSAPDISVRIWPQRLADGSTTEPGSRDPNGFYLFGISLAESGTLDPSSATTLQSSLTSCLRTFERELHGNERYYDPTTSFISVSHTKKSQLPSSIIRDPFTWPDGGIDNEVSDDEAEEEQVEEASIQEEETSTSARDSWEGFQAISSAQRKRDAAAKPKHAPHVPAGKLRTSSDVYNRLIWDNTGSVTKDGYVIGYEDRFKGIKETPLTAWKRETSDESFIPFHRIVYFKRVIDGVNVWDKRTKVDLVFGSGVGAKATS